MGGVGWVVLGVEGWGGACFIASPSNYFARAEALNGLLVTQSTHAGP